jgi:hypothetical protein
MARQENAEGGLRNHVFSYFPFTVACSFLCTAKVYSHTPRRFVLIINFIHYFALSVQSSCCIVWRTNSNVVAAKKESEENLKKVAAEKEAIRVQKRELIMQIQAMMAEVTLSAFRAPLDRTTRFSRVLLTAIALGNNSACIV